MQKTTKQTLKKYFPKSLLRMYRKIQLRRHDRLLEKAWIQPNHKKKRCLILANGPSVLSLQDSLLIHRNSFDLYTVNSSPLSQLFYILKPDVHIIVDSMQFSVTPGTAMAEESANVFAALNAVTWPCAFATYNQFLPKAKEALINQNISFLSCPGHSFKAFQPKNCEWHQKGLRNFGTANVVLIALYLACMAEYETIYLAGVDADLHFTFSVDEHCNMVKVPSHFFQEPEPPLYLNRTVRKHCEAIAKFFAQFEYVAAYAKYHSISIVNLSMQSLLDMFPKGNLDGDIFPCRTLLGNPEEVGLPLQMNKHGQIVPLD